MFNVSSDAARTATDKLNNTITRGRERSMKVLEELNNFSPQDTIIPAGNATITLGSHSDSPEVTLSPDAPLTESLLDTRERGLELNGAPLHRHAAIQILQKSGAPSASKLIDWHKENGTTAELALSAQNAIRNTMKDKRALVRTVDGEVRGFLSDRYRRLDTRPMVDAMVSKAITQYGAAPIEARMNDTNFYIKMVAPKVYEPVENEVGVFGIVFRNSDFGAGRLYMKAFFYRLFCSNLMMTEDGLAQVHLGSQLPDSIELSSRTLELDTMTMASTIADVTESILNPANLDIKIEAIKKAHAENIDAGEALKRLQKASKITKTEMSQASELYNSADVALMPAGNTRWRLSNSLALLAQQSEGDDRQLELENLAGKVAGFHSERGA